MIRSIGMDPDVHGCAFAQLDYFGNGTYDLKVFLVRQREGKGKEAALALIQQDKFKLYMSNPRVDVFTAEGQDVRYTNRSTKANPQDVCNLSLISGAAVSLSVAKVNYCPYPNEWKGSVRKDIKQMRILNGLGIEYILKGGKKPYTVPTDAPIYCANGSDHINAGDWADLTDAVGLAVWGLEKYIRKK